jgi:hypothetical protein
MRAVTRPINTALFDNFQEIELLVTDNGGEPINYPSRSIDFLNISSEVVKDLLNVYDLIYIQTIPELLKKTDLQHFLGSCYNSYRCHSFAAVNQFFLREILNRKVNL